MTSLPHGAPTSERPGRLASLARRLSAPTDIASLVAFRIAFGLVVATSALRFLAYGWIDELFVRTSFRFRYWGFGWVPALPDEWAWALFALLLVLGLCVAAGLFYRAAVALLFVVFTYLQLWDVSNYLNHYYLVSLLALLLNFIPAHRAFSIDARLRPALRSATLPAWCIWLLRFQVAVVYFNAGMAKFTEDWLLHAQPLQIWLSSRTSLPVIGPLLDETWIAYFAAWGGFLFDTTIALWLLLPRTRPWAYLVVIGFHAATRALFPIGMFPVIMVTAALVFFDPSWPRKWLDRLRSRRASAASQPAAVALARAFHVHRLGLAVGGLYCMVQLLMPLRTHLYGGNVLWHEQGMRFSWRVMAREKNGATTFIVRDPATGREWHIPPTRYLTRLQEREMAVQPDLILQLAHQIAADFAAEGRPDVQVFADAKVSLNGRPAAPLIDPDVDLARVKDGLAPKPWIRPAPTEPPIRLRPAGGSLIAGLRRGSGG